MRTRMRLIRLVWLLAVVPAPLLSSCSKQQQAEVAPAQTSTQDLTSFLDQTLPILDGTNQLVLSKGSKGFTAVMSKKTNRMMKDKGQARTNLLLPDDDSGSKLVCSGSGYSFAKCCQGYLDDGTTLTVMKCGDKYCAYA